MQFKQTSSVSRLYTAVDNGDAPPGRLLYLLPQSVTNPPAQISFADSWSAQPGAYLFLAQPLQAGTEPAFAAAAQAFLTDPRLAGARFVWFDQPNDSGLLSGTAIQVYQPLGQSGFATAFPIGFPLRNMALFIAANVAVAIDVANAGFTFTQQGNQSIYFTSGWGGTAVFGVGTTATLPLAGRFAGCLQFVLNLTVAQQAELGIGLRYYYAAPLDVKNPAAATADFFLESLAYPLFADAVTLYAALDPPAPLDGTRSVLAFHAADAGLPAGGSVAPLTSCLRSTLGDVFSLQPLTGADAPTGFAAFVFAAQPHASVATGQPSPPPSPRDGLCLTPRGEFGLHAARTGTVDLMCGLSGVEYIQLQPESNVISFVPGGNAFAAGFFPGQPPGYTTVTPLVPPTTSYVRILTRSANAVAAPMFDYYAQPDQSVLYNYGGGLPASPLTMLAPVPVLAAIVGADDQPVPIMAYGGLNGLDLAAYQQMESQIVSPRRRNLIGKPPKVARPRPDAAVPTSPRSTTPQGLLATYVAGSPVWDQIVLGRTGAAQQDFCFTAVSDDLLAAFQRNKLFLVVSDPDAIKAYLQSTDAQIELGSDPTEPWHFNIAPAAWSGFGTILIIKFYDMAVGELAGQPSTWAFGPEFNAKNAANVSQTIGAIVAAAAAANDPDLATFLNAVSDPNWNGILVLNADAPISNLPPQLAGLAAGIDQSKFYAHHIGINVSKINVEDPTKIDIYNSSVFGLIHYVAPAPLQPNIGDYQFQVTRLKVLFLDSDVASFSSEIELEVNTLFGEPVTLEAPGGGPNDDNIVHLFGVYQRQVVNGHVSESYAFQTQSGEASIFDFLTHAGKATSATLNAVQLNKGQFITVTQPWQIKPQPAGAQRANQVSIITTTAPHTLQIGDSVVLEEVADDTFDGLYQVVSVPNSTSFTFSQPGEPDAQSGGGMARPTKTDSRFVFWGLIDFKALPGFDVFSFGREGGTTPNGVNVGNLIIEMTFDSAADPPVPQFDFDVSKLSFDAAGSFARKASLFNHFPLTIAGFTQAKQGSAPTDLGFMGVQTPLNQASLDYPWFSLNFNLNLGSPGALAAEAGFVATLTAAWSPLSGGDPDVYTVFVGLKLPGSSGASREISLEGIFHVTFRTLEILTPPDKANTFILVLYDIGFKFLSFKFPPNGQVNFVLFGNPDAPGGNTSLGWYAAYAKSQTTPAGGGGGNQQQLQRLARPAAALEDLRGEA
jgi:hypothetical protein